MIGARILAFLAIGLIVLVAAVQVPAFALPSDAAFHAAVSERTRLVISSIAKLTGLGWRPRITLREGIAQTYAWYQQHSAS